MKRNFPRLAGTLALLSYALLPLALTGCGGGGGGGSSSNGGGTNLTGDRAAQAALVSGYQAFQGGANYPFAQVQATLPNGSPLKVALRTAIAAAQAKHAVAHAGPTADGIGLYTSVTTSGNTATLTEYTDAAETRSAGTLTITQTAPVVTTINLGSYTAYPETFTITANLTSGPMPCTGSGTISLLDSAGAGEIKGTFTLPASHVAISADLTLSDAGNIGGTATVTENGQTLTLTNLTGAIDGPITGNIAVSPDGDTGTATLNIANGTFTVTLHTPAGGTATASNDNSGNLNITLPSGASETIASPLTASPTSTYTTTGGGGGSTGPLPLDVATLFPFADWQPAVSNSINGNVLVNNAGQALVVNSYTQITYVPTVNAFASAQTVITVPGSSESAPVSLIGLNKAGEFVANSGISAAYVWASPMATPTILHTSPLGPSDGGETATALSSNGEIVGAVGSELCAWSSAAASPTPLVPLNDTLVTNKGYTLTEVAGSLRVSGPTGPDTVTLTGVGSQPITASYVGGQAVLGLAGTSGTYTATFTATQAGQEVASFPFTLTIGDVSGGVTGVNASGVVVGVSKNGQSFGQMGVPVYWTAGSPHAQTLHAPSGSDADNFTTLGISDSGQIFGNTQSGHVYVWSSITAQPTQLPFLSGGSSATAYAINTANTIAGIGVDSSGQYHAVIWKNGQITDLQPYGTSETTINGTTYNTSLMQATSINDSGIVVGFADLTPFALRTQ